MTADKPYHQRQYLLDMIAHAFDGIVLGRGVSIRETRVLDLCGNGRDMHAARRRDSINDWHSVLKDQEALAVGGIGGPCFLDAEGMRYYLPVHLTLLVTGHKTCPEQTDTVLRLLSQARPHPTDDVFVLLNRQQRRCVRQVIIYLLNNTGDWFADEHQKLKRAMRVYWHASLDSTAKQ